MYQIVPDTTVDELTLVFVSGLLSLVETGVCVCRDGEEMELRPSHLIKCESFSSAVTNKFSWP